MQTALLIATLSVFLARYSNAGNSNNRKYLLGKDVTISAVVDMVNKTATEFGDDFAQATFIHKDILTHALLRLRNHLDTWDIKLVDDQSLGDGRSSRREQYLVLGFGNIGSIHNSKLVQMPEEYTCPEGLEEPARPTFSPQANRAPTILEHIDTIANWFFMMRGK